jgi:hypothetical protein
VVAADGPSLKPDNHLTELPRRLFFMKLYFHPLSGNSRRVQLMSSETRGVKVAATKDGMTIASDNPDLGEVREELEAECNARVANGLAVHIIVPDIRAA